MTELERRIKAKIPGPDTGIEVRHTMCDICSPGMHCGINAYIKDGKVIKIEGIDGHPSNDGRLCTKGMANREYIYREDRIKTPLRRVGKRGEGRFEPISWEEAYEEIAKGLNRCKEKYGAESAAAHKLLPLGTKVRVTHLRNGKSIVVRVNDRGPFVGDRIIDLSYASAKELGMIGTGTARVRVEAIETFGGASPGDMNGSFYIQIAALSSQASAQDLVRRLHGSGYCP